MGTEESLVYCPDADYNIVPPTYNAHTYDVSIYCRTGLCAHGVTIYLSAYWPIGAIGLQDHTKSITSLKF